MAQEKRTVKQFFEPLSGQIFGTRESLEGSILREYNKVSEHYPGKTFWDFRDYGYEQQYIRMLPDGRLQVVVDAPQGDSASSVSVSPQEIEWLYHLGAADYQDTIGQNRNPWLVSLRDKGLAEKHPSEHDENRSRELVTEHVSRGEYAAALPILQDLVAHPSSVWGLTEKGRAFFATLPPRRA